tara:strand:+ start:218 stop:547 length:330 start_codon:yes stop_codon:yes gene_type:complete
MAQIYEILGQVSPTANTLTNVFVTGAATSSIVGTITISNFSDANASYSLVVRPINEALANKHFIVRGGVLPARELITITGAVTMNANAILAANTNNGSVSFNAFGVEIV